MKMNKENIFENFLSDNCKTLDEYSNYLFFADGRIYSNNRKRFIGYKLPNGYIGCTLTNDSGKSEKSYIHRWIYKAFIGDLENGMNINHRNEIKEDNRPENLEQTTPKNNANYGTRKQRISISRRRNEAKKRLEYLEFLELENKENETKSTNILKEKLELYEKIKALDEEEIRVLTEWKTKINK